MGWLAVLLVALAGWLIWTGRLRRMTAKDGMALGLALVGAVLSARGNGALGTPLLLATALFFVQRSRFAPRKGVKRAPPPSLSDLDQARALLGLSADADADAIRAAHRRLIASVHPDRGGTEALAAQINAARDLLLAHRAGRDRA
ncbi:MAG: molecular chaperone DnaJ [Sphingobium sp.]